MSWFQMFDAVRSNGGKFRRGAAFLLKAKGFHP
jgi:hypothetical protein